VAVSGGADSVALLRLLLELREELGLLLSVVHFHHQIRGADADADQTFVADLAASHGLDLHVGFGDTPSVAKTEHVSMEAAARGLRYGCFAELIVERRLDKVATAHTLDDQAETVLLKMLRGAGTRGLAGIYPRVQVDPEEDNVVGSVVRPLLRFRRAELREYLRSLGQMWREDASNLDQTHRRNRVRLGLIPLLESDFNPRVVERLGELAEIARAEEEYWEQLVRDVIVEREPISLASLHRLPAALQRRLLRAAAASHGLNVSFEDVERIISLGESPPGPGKRLALSGGWQVRRIRDRLRFEQGGSTQSVAEYEYSFSVPGEFIVEEIGVIIRAESVRTADLHQDPLLSAKILKSGSVLRNWRPGDRFWPPHSKAPKKVKELLQERHIPGEQRKSWPVIVSKGDLVWMRGFPVPEHAQPSSHETEAIRIQEAPLAGSTPEGARPKMR
jgi:tRNA(Ile)-lysidine synthase